MTRDTLHVLTLACILLFIGTAIFVYKSRVLGFPVLPDAEGDSRILEAHISFESKGKPLSVHAALPVSGNGVSVIDVHYVAPGYGTFTKKTDDARTAVFERRTPRKGAHTVYYRARILPLDVSSSYTGATPKPITDFSDKEREKLLRGNAPPAVAILERFIQQGRARSADEAGLVSALAAIASEEGRLLDEAVAVIGLAEFADTSERLAFVLNAAGIPARSVIGIIAGQETRRASLYHRTFAYIEGRRLSIDADNSRIIDPREEFFVPLTYNGADILHARGVNDPNIFFSIRHATESPAAQAIWRSEKIAPIVSALSLLTLPTDAQLVFKVLLMVPIGALVITVFRQLIGLKTFGTFMPVLIALAFRETQLLNGLILFTIIVGLGLMIREYFNRLHLLLVPRLAGMLTIVTLLVTVLALIGEAFAVTAGFSIALFPLVIMTMTIETMSLDWDEFGAKEAFSRAAGSLFAASCGYMCISNSYVEHLGFMFPELLLIVLAITIMLGRYNGYTLTEFYRFRELRKRMMHHTKKN